MIWHYWPTWTNTYCGVLEVIKAVVCENKPSPFPGFHTSSWNIRGDMLLPNVKMVNVQLLLFNHFRFSPAQYIPPEKTSSNSSSRGCESQGRRREEEKEGEEEEKDFISNSGQRPRHAEENNQNLSLSCHKKESLSPCFLNFQHRELTNQVELRSQCQIQEVRSITTQHERAFPTQRRSPRSTHQQLFCLTAQVPKNRVEGRRASYRVSEASPPCLGWRRYASGHSHHPREF